MPTESSALSTRRNILAAAAGAAAAAVATFIGRPLSARAADGDPLLLGAANTAQSKTSLSTSTAPTGLEVLNTRTEGTPGGGAPMAIHGFSPSGFGVFGSSTSGVGVRGNGIDLGGNGVEGLAQANGFGVWGSSASGIGIRGEATDDYGVSGTSSTAAGVHGSSTSGPGVQGVSGTGYGVLAQTATGVAVRGESSSSGTGVNGSSATGTGVLGSSTTGQGVRGEATSGTGGFFTATTGTALRTEGRVRFSTSGLATITAGSRSVTVTPGTDIAGGSRILCTLEGDPGGATALQRVTKSIAGNTFQVFLTANTVRNVRVAWFVIG